MLKWCNHWSRELQKLLPDYRNPYTTKLPLLTDSISASLNKPTIHRTSKCECWYFHSQKRLDNELNAYSSHVFRALYTSTLHSAFATTSLHKQSSPNTWNNTLLHFDSTPPIYEIPPAQYAYLHTAGIIIICIQHIPFWVKRMHTCDTTCVYVYISDCQYT